MGDLYLKTVTEEEMINVIMAASVTSPDGIAVIGFSLYGVKFTMKLEAPLNFLSVWTGLGMKEAL